MNQRSDGYMEMKQQHINQDLFAILRGYRISFACSKCRWMFQKRTMTSQRNAVNKYIKSTCRPSGVNVIKDCLKEKTSEFPFFLIIHVWTLANWVKLNGPQKHLWRLHRTNHPTRVLNIRFTTRGKYSIIHWTDVIHFQEDDHIHSFLQLNRIHKKDTFLIS